MQLYVEIYLNSRGTNLKPWSVYTRDICYDFSWDFLPHEYKEVNEVDSSCNS